MKIGASIHLPEFAESMVDRIRAAHQAAQQEKTSAATVVESEKASVEEPSRGEVRLKLEALVSEVLAGEEESQEVVREALGVMVSTGLEGELDDPEIREKVMEAMCSDPMVWREVDEILQAIAAEMVGR